MRHTRARTPARHDLESPVKPYPRIRKTVKWGGAVVSVLLLVVLVWSRWRVLGLGPAPGWAMWIEGGEVSVAYAPKFYNGFSFPSWSPRLATREWIWSSYWGMSQTQDRRTGPWTMVDFPLWAPIAISLLFTATAWRLDTLARRLVWCQPAR